jgi:hypothetical protein
MFQATNPELVRGEPDRLSARMVGDRDRDEVMKMTVWRQVESYRRFSRSARFREAMAGFAGHLPRRAGGPGLRPSG